ncbi:GDT1-like protein 1, chloroplastic isoform X1 [Typha angustifolia]|uniref:GDT1-like protein 1, chloroplastic isoform X1 n=1 Tax=Typha angustifolia TaxID=59011 RepID=UPI003C2F1B11
MSALNICNGSMEAGFRSVFPKNRVKSAIFPPPSDTNSLRCLNQSFRFRHVAKILRRHYLQPLSFSSHWMEHSKRTLGLMDNGHSLEDSLHNDISFPNTGPSGSVKGNEILLSDIYKFTVLTGLLIFQGSQAANAGSEFTGAQPISFIGDLGDISTGFASAFLLIFFSELGDKTFFIAALLAARNSGAIVFLGTFGALAAMSVVSVVLGRAFHYVDGIVPFRLGDADFPVDDFAAVCLLVYFGVTTLLEAASGEEQKIKEEQEEAELAISELSGNGAGIMAAASTALSTFLLVFVAEWGDKSFFSTIALAAASSPLGVIGGALAGHAVATLLAVVGGSLLGTFLSEKVIAYIGGSLFLVFAAVTLIEIVN